MAAEMFSGVRTVHSASPTSEVVTGWARGYVETANKAAQFFPESNKTRQGVQRVLILMESAGAANSALLLAAQSGTIDHFTKAVEEERQFRATLNSASGTCSALP